MKLIHEHHYELEPRDFLKLTNHERLVINKFKKFGKELFEDARRDFGFNILDEIEVTYLVNCFNMGTNKNLAGNCYSSQWKTGVEIFQRHVVTISLATLSAFGQEEMFTTLVHEVGHAISHSFSWEEASADHHGKLWQETMQYLGQPAEQYFDMKLVPFDTVNRWEEYHRERFPINK